MKIDFNAQILNFNNAPFVLPQEQMTEDNVPTTVHVPLTLRIVCQHALLEPSDDDLDAKTKCGDLTLRLQESSDGVVNLSTEEIAFVKKYVAKHWKQPMIVTRAVRILEGLEEPKV